MLRCASALFVVVLSSCICGAPTPSNTPHDAPGPAPAVRPAAAKPTPRPAPVVDVLVVGVCETVAGRLPAQRTTTQKALQASCFADSWPAAAVACFAAVRDDAGIAACGAQLEPAREDWLRYRLGDAEDKPTGWACRQLQDLMREAASCPRYDDDNDPLPEIRDTLPELQQAQTATADSARSVELRCLSIQRIVRSYIDTHVCLKKP